MNREIKFRAWDDGKKKWLLGYELPSLGGFNLLGEVMLLGEWSKIIDDYIFERSTHKQEDLKIMQYTGLKDKNGKEIYEGDVLGADNMSGTVVVRWNLDTQGYSPYVGIDTEWEVVGNIYENPELAT